MSAVRTPFMLLVLAVGVWYVSVDSRAQDAEAQLPPPTDPSPPTLAQMPSGPTVALYQNGQLTIEAQNATLSDVLRAACRQTGTEIDLPPGTDERVFGIYGPGPPGEVIASLLNGSRFNYVMLGSAHDANRLGRLTLTPKPAGPPDNRPVRPAIEPVSRAVEAAPIPQLPPPQAKQPSAEPSPADSRTPARFPPRRRHRGR